MRRVHLLLLSSLSILVACSEEFEPRPTPADPPASLAVVVLAEGDTSLLWESAQASPELARRCRAGTVFERSYAASEDPEAARRALGNLARLREGAGSAWAKAESFDEGDEPADLARFWAEGQGLRCSWLELPDARELDPWLAALPEGLDGAPILILTAVHPPGELARLAPHPEALGTPLLLSGPGIPAAQLRPQFVSGADLLPTLFELAAGDPSAAQGGASFARLAQMRPVAWRNDVVIHGAAGGAWRAVLHNREATLARAADGTDHFEPGPGGALPPESVRERMLARLDAALGSGRE